MVFFSDGVIVRKESARKNSRRWLVSLHGSGNAGDMVPSPACSPRCAEHSGKHTEGRTGHTQPQISNLWPDADSGASGTATAKEQRAMTATAKKVYDGLTEHVSSDDDRERIRRSLYRTDESALGSVLPAWRERWTDA